jgi:DNA polymerase-3 subunit alpha (Gram-positive type)
MLTLIRYGLDPSEAFSIMEKVRKGKGLTPEWETDMRAHNVPDWYIGSCKKIKYMFPKAHAAAYVMASVKLGWFKIYHPSAFYAATLTKHTENIDVDTVLKGKEAVRGRMQAIKANPEATAKDEAVYDALQIVYEMLCRGINFLPVHYEKSHATKYLIENGDLRLPFMAVAGCGESAAIMLYEAVQKGGYVSVEDIAAESGVNSSVIEKLKDEE